jgi:hypothetical protein
MPIQFENFQIIKKEDTRPGLTSSIASLMYGPFCKQKALALPVARLFAKHLLDSGQKSCLPAYCGTKAILLRKPLSSINLKKINGKYFIPIKGKFNTEYFEIQEKFLSGDSFRAESQIILYSQGWQTRLTAQKLFTTTMQAENDATSHPLPVGDEYVKTKKYQALKVDASAYPWLFGEGANGEGRLGLSKDEVSGGLIVVGAGTCKQGMLIPIFSSNLNLLVYR